jgi:hypothetical protein
MVKLDAWWTSDRLANALLVLPLSICTSSTHRTRLRLAGAAAVFVCEGDVEMDDIRTVDCTYDAVIDGGTTAGTEEISTRAAASGDA